MPLSLHDRNPDLIQRVDEAYERAIIAQGELVGGVGGIALDALISDDVTAAREQGSLAGSGLETVTDPGTRAAFGEALTRSEQLFGRIGLTTPSAEQLAESGIDFAKLATAHEAMTRLGLAPEVVFAPVLAVQQWRQAYQGLQDDPAINHDGRIQNSGLFVSTEIETNFAALSASEHDIAIDGDVWQVMVVPGTDKPSIVSIDHNGVIDKHSTVSPALNEQAAALVEPSERTVNRLHPTIPAYLTLQAGRLLRGEPPIDESSYTWLHGSYGKADALQAPLGFWDPGDGQVGLSQGVVGSRDVDLGVRLPVWGS